MLIRFKQEVIQQAFLLACEELCNHPSRRRPRSCNQLRSARACLLPAIALDVAAELARTTTTVSLMSTAGAIGGALALPARSSDRNFEASSAASISAGSIDMRLVYIGGAPTARVACFSCTFSLPILPVSRFLSVAMVFQPFTILQLAQYILPFSIYAGTALAVNSAFNVKTHSKGWQFASVSSNTTDDSQVSTGDDLTVCFLVSA